MKWLTGALLVVAAVLAGLLLYRQVLPPAVSGGDAIEPARPLPAIALLNDQGKDTTLAAGDGRLRLVFYGFVRCPDVCPTTLAALKNMYVKLTPEQQRRVQVQFITVDPEFDRPALVREYLNKFDPAFTGLTGTTPAIEQAAKEMFVGIVKRVPAGESTGDSPDHSAHTATPEAGAAGSGAQNATSAGVSATQAAIIHGDQVSVIDAQNRFVRVYGNAAVIQGELERDLPGLIRQYGPQ